MIFEPKNNFAVILNDFDMKYWAIYTPHIDYN